MYNKSMSVDRKTGQVVNLGPNSIWAKFQLQSTVVTTPDHPVKAGQFPDSGTSLFIEHTLSKSDEVVQPGPINPTEVLNKPFEDFPHSTQKVLRHLQTHSAPLGVDPTTVIVKSIFLVEPLSKTPIEELSIKLGLDEQNIRRRLLDSEKDDLDNPDWIAFKNNLLQAFAPEEEPPNPEVEKKALIRFGGIKPMPKDIFLFTREALDFTEANSNPKAFSVFMAFLEKTNRKPSVIWSWAGNLAIQRILFQFIRVLCKEYLTDILKIWVLKGSANTIAAYSIPLTHSISV